MWDDLLGLVKVVPARGRVVLKVRLSDFEREREQRIARQKRWREKHRELLRVRDAQRRRLRAHLYRKGGRYYEERKADPLDKLAQRLYQRDRRARLSRSG